MQLRITVDSTRTGRAADVESPDSLAALEKLCREDLEDEIRHLFDLVGA